MDKLHNQDLLNQVHQNPSMGYDVGDHSSDDSDFSDSVLRYISEILMEEHIEEETFMLQDSLQLQTAEKSFYDVLGQDYPPPPPSPRGLRRKDLETEEEEDRIKKQAALYEEPELRSEKFDLVLLTSSLGKGIGPFMDLRKSLQNGVAKNQSPKNSKSRGKPKPETQNPNKKKHHIEEELIDLRALLVQCAQAIARNDYTSSGEILAKIRRHSSPFGDGTQRLAHCFANGLEARMAGTGSQIYRGLVNKRRKAGEMLKAYQLYLAACPFQRISNLVSNRTILNLVAQDQGAINIHIIDFGILYGFQWPTLIQHFANRRSPIKLRITGIDLPQSGFRPCARVEETGRRLEDYARSFGVPFEYIAVAKRWEAIRIEELKIETDEIVVVNCMYRFKNLFDETVMEESPRDAVLKLVRAIEPVVFIHGVVNGTHNAPFFVTRFREALYHFSSLFDMVDVVVPKENLERMVIEKDLFGWEALNCIACEGWERVERPETYKQWQVRNLRAGFKQVALEKSIVKFAIGMMQSKYHKDFMIDEVSKWLLQGWKGRFLFALSTWKPT